MAEEKIFADGFIFKKDEQSPEFVIGKIITWNLTLGNLQKRKKVLQILMKEMMICPSKSMCWGEIPSIFLLSVDFNHPYSSSIVI